MKGTELVHVNIVDPESGTLQKDEAIRLEGGVIAAVGAGAREGDEIIDAGGAYLLPGLVNLHVHIARRHLSRGTGAFRQGAPYVENSPVEKRMLWALQNAWYELLRGVTTLRDCACCDRLAGALRDAVAEGVARGPRLVSCGFGIAGTGGHETHLYRGAVEANGADAVRGAVRAEIKAGADFIKLMASGGLGGMPEHEHPNWTEFTVAEMSAAVEEAHNRNRTVTVHAMGARPVKNALAAGVDGIEHGACLTDELIRQMKERDVYYVPTRSGITSVADKEERQGNAALAALMRAEVVDPQADSIRRAWEAGIRIGAGTDTLGDLRRELHLLHECGLPNDACLRAATSTAAGILGKADKLGRIEPGYTADLVLVGGDPLRSLAALDDVRAVFLAGRRVTPEWLVCGDVSD